MNLLFLLAPLRCGALVIRRLLYNLVKMKFLTCVERLLLTQHEVFKFRAFNLTTRLLAKGTYPVLQREKSTAINNLFLPEDVLLEILARLPVKSLLRFRSVSKSWRDMVKEPTFITKHRLNQVAIRDGKCVLAKIGREDPYALGFLVEDEQEGIKFTRSELSFIECTNSVYIELAGPCNGIFIMSSGTLLVPLFLWNPATREYKALPPTSFMPSYGWFSRVGFGIDPFSKDYKVVRVWSHDFDDKEEVIVEVMSLSATDSCRPKSETWKTIDAVPSIRLTSHRSDQIYANGKYYWGDDPSSFGEYYQIVWFDMGAEVFGLIHVPLLQYHSWYHRLTMVKGSLAVIRNAGRLEENKKKTMYEIWIIDDYPWTKYATIGPLVQYQQPLGLWSNQEVIVYSPFDPVTHHHTQQVFSYDIKTNGIKKKMEGLYMDVFYPSFDIYSESLISFAE